MILELQGLTIRYGAFTALNSFNLNFEGGAMGLLGPNGAGKSSLIRTMLGLVKPAEGSGKVLDLDIRTHGLEIRRGVGYMPERDCFIPAMSGLRSIQYMGELAGMPAREARARAHEVSHWVGLGDERYRPVETYSTGMRQRVKFAQAIVHSPRLIFLDEPTNGLDPVGHRKMLDLICEIVQETKVNLIIATHLLHDVEITCDQVTVIESGEMRRHGSIQSLRKRDAGLFRLRISGDLLAFQSEAQKMGLQATTKIEGEFEILVPAELSTQNIFNAAASSHCYVVELEESRRSLQEVFLESLSKN